MTKSRGEGRAKNEKSQRVFEPGYVTKARRERKKAEEKEWADKSGPVEVRKIND